MGVAELNVTGMLTELGETVDKPGPAAPTMGRLKRISYSHDAMIDLIIEHPELDQNQIAAQFGYTAAWISNILASDAFKSRLSARREQIIDPELKATVKERMEALYIQSMKVLSEKLAKPQVSDTLALRAAELGARGMGFGQPQIVAPPTQPGVERLERLAERLVLLQSNVRRGVTYEAESIPGESAALPGEQSGVPAQQVRGSESGGGEPAEAAIRADAGISGSGPL